MYDYLVLNATAPIRLHRLRENARKFNEKHAARREGLPPHTWRDQRYATYLSYTGLSQGRNYDLPIWYEHMSKKGYHFQTFKFKDAHEVLNERRYSSGLHTGWYTDSDCHALAIGIIVKLPHNRWIAGYRWTDNDELVYYGEIYDDEYEAAQAADGHAESFAEVCREDSERFDAARELEDEIEEAAKRLGEVLDLRNHPRHTGAREEAHELIDTIREKRETLRTEYADYI